MSENIRLFNGNVKAKVNTDQEIWDLHVAVTHRLTEAISPARIAIAQADYQKTFELCVRRDLLVENYPKEQA